MSHPNPSHDRENEYPHDEYSAGPRAKALKKKSKPKTVKTLKAMIKEPASKEWFAKYH